MDYEPLYLTLFNSMTDALACLEKQDTESAIQILMRAQQQAEELYISALPE